MPKCYCSVSLILFYYLMFGKFFCIQLHLSWILHLHLHSAYLRIQQQQPKPKSSCLPLLQRSIPFGWKRIDVLSWEPSDLPLQILAWFVKSCNSRYRASSFFFFFLWFSSFINFDPTDCWIQVLDEEICERILSPHKKVLKWIEDTRDATQPHFDEIHAIIFKVKQKLQQMQSRETTSTGTSLQSKIWEMEGADVGSKSSSLFSFFHAIYPWKMFYCFSCL